MKLQRALNAVVIVLLLYVQQAAFAHALTHLGKVAPSSEQLAHSKACGQCVGFEKISGMAPASVPALDAPALGFCPAAYQPHHFTARAVALFRSRAPPALL